MTIKRGIAENRLRICAMISNCILSKRLSAPRSIFILRNNGLGDLLCITPLFQLLHEKFPYAKITVGVGDWHKDLLDGNPYINGQLRVNAPWHNQFCATKNIIKVLWYILFSREAKKLTLSKFDIGIDILGSFWGSLLFLRAKIPRRLGVKGYAGGHSSTEGYVLFNEKTHVTTASLKFGSILGTQEKEYLKPQLFLSFNEKNEGEEFWSNQNSFRVVIAPGGSFEEKCWPSNHYCELTRLLLEINATVILIGDTKVNFPDSDLNNNSINLIGKTTLRQSCALIATCDLVISNSSFAMHVAAAFNINNIVLLGEWYESAKEHQMQWGHLKTTILGKELDEGINKIVSVEEAFITAKVLTKDFATNNTQLNSH